MKTYNKFLFFSILLFFSLFFATQIARAADTVTATATVSGITSGSSDKWGSKCNNLNGTYTITSSIDQRSCDIYFQKDTTRANNITDRVTLEFRNNGSGVMSPISFYYSLWDNTCGVGAGYGVSCYEYYSVSFSPFTQTGSRTWSLAGLGPYGDSKFNAWRYQSTLLTYGCDPGSCWVNSSTCIDPVPGSCQGFWDQWGYYHYSCDCNRPDSCNYSGAQISISSPFIPCPTPGCNSDSDCADKFGPQDTKPKCADTANNNVVDAQAKIVKRLPSCNLSTHKCEVVDGDTVKTCDKTTIDDATHCVGPSVGDGYMLKVGSDQHNKGCVDLACRPKGIDGTCDHVANPNAPLNSNPGASIDWLCKLGDPTNNGCATSQCYCPATCYSAAGNTFIRDTCDGKGKWTGKKYCTPDSGAGASVLNSKSDNSAPTPDATMTGTDGSGIVWGREVNVCVQSTSDYAGCSTIPARGSYIPSDKASPLGNPGFGCWPSHPFFYPGVCGRMDTKYDCFVCRNGEFYPPYSGPPAQYKVYNEWVNMFPARTPCGGNGNGNGSNPATNCIVGTTRACACGVGTQICDANGNWSPCPSCHMACDNNNTCAITAGAGQDSCDPAQAGQCLCKPGTTKPCVCGGDQVCQNDGTWGDCPNAHAVCDAITGKCTCEAGSGTDECSTLGAKCKCSATDTPPPCPCGGTQTCNVSTGEWSGCPDNHTECKNGICTCVANSNPGVGEQNECQVVGAVCPCTDGDTKSCLCGGNQICVNGSWGDCPNNHADCVAGICKCVVGGGQDNCQVLNAACPCNDGDTKSCLCGGEQVCINGAWGNCPDAHTDCVDGKCQCVQEPGQDLCQVLGENCPCTPGSIESCGCDGTRTCNYDGTWTECNGTKHKDCVGTSCECVNNTEYDTENLCTDNSCKIHNPPTVSGLKVGDKYCGYSLTGIPGSGLAAFQWTFNPSEGLPETKYQLQISTGASFNTSNIVFDSCMLAGTCDGSAKQKNIPILLSVTNSTNDCVNSATKCDHLNYGVNYYWRVRVWDSKTEGSPTWYTYSDNGGIYRFSYTHPGPTVLYAPPTSASPSIAANFSEGSVCYNVAGDSFPCSQLDPATQCTKAPYLDNAGKKGCYGWWFGDTNTSRPDDFTEGGTSHAYILPKTYTTKLQICDDQECCYAIGPVTVGTSKANKVPQWWEISPYTPQ